MNEQEAKIYELQEKVAQLKTVLLSKHPSMPKLLQEIHGALQKQPENVTLLSVGELSTLFDALKVQTGVSFAEAVVKDSKKVTTKSLMAQLKAGGSNVI